MEKVLQIFSICIQTSQIELDIDSLTSFCYDIQQKDRGVVKTNIGGWQSGNIRNNIHPEFVNLLFEIQTAVDKYHNELQFKKQKFGFLLPNLSLGLNDGMFGGIGVDPMGNQNFFSASLMWYIPLSRFFQAGELEKQNILKKFVKNFQ